MPRRSSVSQTARRRRRALALTASMLIVSAFGGGAPVAFATAGMAEMSGMSTAAPANIAHGHGAAPASTPMFRVGSEQHPLLADGPAGPLWVATTMNPPGRASHGTFAELTVAHEIASEAAARVAGEGRRALVAAAARATPAAASSTVLTTSAATKKLSKSCQRLIKARASRLSKKDRRKRSACIEQRKALVAASLKPIAPGVTAPAAPIQGPAPVAGTAPSPSSTQPTGTTPVATTPAGTPTPTPAPTAGPVYAALTAKAIDSDVPFSLTRASVNADVVAFGLENHDRQAHNLSIAATDSSGNIVGPIKTIIASAAPDQNLYQDMSLKPGTYELICTVEGHGPMMVAITVIAPPKS